jgi:hypothetical protein
LGSRIWRVPKLLSEVHGEGQMMTVQNDARFLKAMHIVPDLEVPMPARAKPGKPANWDDYDMETETVEQENQYLDGCLRRALHVNLERDREIQTLRQVCWGLMVCIVAGLVWAWSR